MTTDKLKILMWKMPVEWAGRWCEPDALGCACMGCANNSGGLLKAGFTKEDWEAWKIEFGKAPSPSIKHD